MSADQPQNPFAVSLTPGSTPTTKSIGRGGEMFAAQIHGKYYTAAYYQRLFTFNVTAQTIPLASTNMASKFSLYNVPTSTINVELVDVDLGVVSASTVVDTVGLYWQNPTQSTSSSSPTAATFGTNWFQGYLGGNAGQATPYTALTLAVAGASLATQLPRIDILAQFGGVTSSNDIPIHKEFDGKIIVAVGCSVHVAMSTGASSGNFTDVGIRWMEVPLT